MNLQSKYPKRRKISALKYWNVKSKINYLSRTPTELGMSCSFFPHKLLRLIMPQTFSCHENNKMDN